MLSQVSSQAIWTLTDTLTDIQMGAGVKMGAHRHWKISLRDKEVGIGERYFILVSLHRSKYPTGSFESNFFFSIRIIEWSQSDALLSFFAPGGTRIFHFRAKFAKWQNSGKDTRI